jgi:HSP20 family molecular chaperone IbpA
MNNNNLSKQATRLMTSLMVVPACQRPDEDTDWFPAVDLAETGQEYVFEVDLPGLKPEEIQFEVDSAAISISGKRVPRSQGGRWLRVERPSGAFIRQLPLPPNTTGEIYGSFADGVLELRVPKSSHGSKTRSAQAVAREPEEAVPMKSPPVDLTPGIRSEEDSCNDGSFMRASLI